jgi:hypothetical protein
MHDKAVFVWQSHFDPQGSVAINIMSELKTHA